MALRVTEKSRVLIELPMQLFLRIADGDGKMTVHEMTRFDQLIAKREWCRSTLLPMALANTQNEKADLWKLYAKGELKTSIEAVVASLDTVLKGLPAEDVEPMKADLVRFARELTKAASAGAGLFQNDEEANKAFEELNAQISRPSDSIAQPVAAAASNATRTVKLADVAPHLTDNVTNEQAWRSGKIQLRCVQVLQETHDVRTFRFVAIPAKLFFYKPGQFVTLELMVDGKPVRRSYTISATPSRPLLLSVTVKRVEGGAISNWLHDNLKVGDTLFADGPHGKFTCVEDENDRFLFISGGSGVTPLISMARFLTDTSYNADIHFIHFARSPVDLLFEHELRVIQRDAAAFQAEFVVSNVGSRTDWAGRTGRISAELVQAACPDFPTRSVYVCGPTPFMEATREVFKSLGFGMDRFHFESFGGVPRHNQAAAATTTGVTSKVTFTASKIEVNCQGSDYILDLALASNLPVSFSCRAGQCGTCKVVLLKGDVEQDCSDALSASDVKEGFILSCQARPKGEVLIDL